MIIYRCDADSPSGYSRAARMTMRCMIEAGLDVRIEQNKKDNATVEFDKFWLENYEKHLLNVPIKKCIRIWHETPEFYEPMPSTYDIGLVAWETDSIVDFEENNNPRTNWVKQMNRMNEIWTFAEFAKQAFIDSGVTTPIYVFPHPIDIELYKNIPGEKIYDAYGKVISDNKLNLISVFQWNKRKNPDGLLLAYLTTFDQHKDTLLTLKTYGSSLQGPNNHLLETIKGFKNSLRLKNPPMMQGLWSNITEENMPNLYSAYDALIGLPYGEGFGLPFQEAMCCEIPVIYPKSSAMLDYIDETVGYGIEVDVEPVWGMPIPWFTANQLWWKPNYMSAKETLLKVYSDWKSGKLKEKGKLARQRIIELHSLEVVGNGIKKRINDINFQPQDH